MHTYGVFGAVETRDSGPPKEQGLPTQLPCLGGSGKWGVIRAGNFKGASSLSQSLFLPFCFPLHILELLLWHLTFTPNPRESWFDWRGWLSSLFWGKTLAQSYLVDHPPASVGQAHIRYPCPVQSVATSVPTTAYPCFSEQWAGAGILHWNVNVDRSPKARIGTSEWKLQKARFNFMQSPLKWKRP